MSVVREFTFHASDVLIAVAGVVAQGSVSNNDGDDHVSSCRRLANIIPDSFSRQHKKSHAV